MRGTLHALNPLRAFTVIEILLCVLVLSIVAALAYPAIQKAIQRSQTAACASNLRQIFVGISLYAGENQGRLPPASNATMSGGSVTARAWWYRGLWGLEYVASNQRSLDKITRCPGDKTPGERNPVTNQPVPGVYVSYSWASHFLQTWVNGAPSAVDPNNPRAHESYVMLGKVGKKILMVDGVTTSPYGTGALAPTAARVNTISDRHQGGSNVLFGDGSVRWMSKTDLVNQPNLYNIYSP